MFRVTDISRARKIRCDGSKPVCTTCISRNLHSECHYDERLKRRGPDRVPRVRLSHNRLTKMKQQQKTNNATDLPSDSPSSSGGLIEMGINLGTSKGEGPFVSVMQAEVLSRYR